MKLVLPILWIAVVVLLAASAVCLCLERGFRPFAGLEALVGRLSARQRFMAALAVSLLVAYAGTKTNEPPRTASAPEVVALTDEQLAAGFALVETSTNLQSSIFNPQSSATVHGPWLLRGAFEDRFTLAPEGWRFQAGTNAWTNLVVFASGEVRPSIAASAFIAPFRAPLGIAPEANWHLLDNPQSSISNPQSPIFNRFSGIASRHRTRCC